MSILTKTPLDILQEAASSENFTITDMMRDALKDEFSDTYADITTVEEAINYAPQMIPVFEASDKSAYYVEMDNVVKYMRSANVKDINDALYDIAEANDLSADSMTILIESSDWAFAVLEEAEKADKAGDKSKMEKIKKSTQLLKKLKEKNIKVAKKKGK